MNNKIKKEFSQKIKAYRKELEEYQEDKIESGSEKEEGYLKLLKDILALKMPDEISYDRKLFNELFSLQMEAGQSLREISSTPSMSRLE